MIGVDYAILGILLISSFISLVRGFVKEALSLAGWIMAFWLSLSFAVPLSKLLAASMEDPTLRLILSFVVLFILTLIVSAVSPGAAHGADRDGPVSRCHLWFLARRLAGIRAGIAGGADHLAQGNLVG